MNNERYWNDCSFIYQTLTNRLGVPKDQIIPIMSDGNDPGADMLSLSGVYTSQSLDLDHDGENENILPATRNSMYETFKSLDKKMHDGDHLFVYVIDHGGWDDTLKRAYICLWGNEKMYDTDFADVVSWASNDKTINTSVLLGQCYSGAFAKIMNRYGYVVATACGPNQPSWACPDLPYDEFVYQWTCAINNADYKMAPLDWGIHPDQTISMRDAFDLAYKHDRRPESPMYNSNPDKAGIYNAMADMPDDIDLYIRDNEGDFGFMPNTTTDKNWLSPDIWVRNADDGGDVYENPYYSQNHTKAYIYVRVTNRGKKPIVSDKWLHMHWALASSGFTYNTWVGKQKDSQGRCIGEHMPAIKLPKIAAGSSTIIKIPWTLPGELMTNTDPVSHHFCLFAKITDSQTDAKSIDGSRYYDVLNSKLQAQRNVTIVDAKSASKGVSVYVRNPEETQQTFSLELVPRTGADEALYQKASIGMEMAPKISAGWQQGGMRVMNMAAVPAVNARGNRVVRFASPDNRVESISLGAEEFDKVTLRFDFDKFATEDETYTFDLIQRAEDGTIVGGETFVINAPRQSAEGVGIATAEKADGTVELAAVGNAGFETLSWTDASGNEIGTGNTISVTPTAQNSEFTVKAYTADGEGAKASVSLEPARGIRSVDTDGRDVAVVTLISAAGGDSRLVVTSVLNNTECMSVPLAEGAVKEEIDLSALPQGVYAVTYIAGDNVIGTVKFTR